MAEHPQPPDPPAGSSKKKPKPAKKRKRTKMLRADEVAATQEGGEQPSGAAAPSTESVRSPDGVPMESAPPNDGKKTGSGRGSKTPRRPIVPKNKEDRCPAPVPSSGNQNRTCTRYRATYSDGSRRPFCITHLKLEPPPTPQEILGEKDRELLAKVKANQEVARGLTDYEIQMVQRLRKPIFDPKHPPKTQDDIHIARVTLMTWVQGGGDPSVAQVILRALKETSDHLEMFGGEEGSEGGARVLRLLPGMTLVERQDLAEVPLRYEELALVQAGQDDDIAHGVAPPKSMESAIVRYIGKPRAAATIYNQKTQDPEGLRFYSQNGELTYSFAELEARARKRWARIRAEEAEAAKNPKPVVDDGELPQGLMG